MGAARRVLDNKSFPVEVDRDRKRQQLQSDLERALKRLKTDRANGARNEAYAKALIRLNEFLLQERVLVMEERL